MLKLSQYRVVGRKAQLSVDSCTLCIYTEHVSGRANQKYVYKHVCMFVEEAVWYQWLPTEPFLCRLLPLPLHWQYFLNHSPAALAMFSTSKGAICLSGYVPPDNSG